MNRFISAVLAAAMALSMNGMFAYADVGTPKTTSATLKATANSTYTITVPESVAMTSASGGAGNYTGTVPVNIKGDIEENAKIVVSASATAMTSGNNSAAVTFTSVPKPNGIALTFSIPALPPTTRCRQRLRPVSGRELPHSVARNCTTSISRFSPVICRRHRITAGL